NNSIVNQVWSQSYQFIYQANAILDGLEGNSNEIPVSLKEQLLGEALFLRAFFHFYLVELFGDVPLVVGTDYRVNSTLTRTSANEVFDQIILDLKNAVKLLLPDKTFGEGDSIRPNRWAAAALLARVHLYKENWQDAVQEASSV